MNKVQPVDGRRREEEMMGHQTLDIEASLSLAARIGAEPNACWSNAWDAITDLPGYFAGGVHVEGWLVIETALEVHLIEHGWCELADRRIVDPTMISLAGDWRTAYYFAGYRLSWWQVAQLATHEEISLPVVRHSGYRDDGLEHPGYREA